MALQTCMKSRYLNFIPTKVSMNENNLQTNFLFISNNIVFKWRWYRIRKLVLGQSILAVKTIAQMLEKFCINVGFVAELNR